MKKLTLGLDIGVSSVGWGIIDEESGNIIDCAVRIFPQSEKDDNLTRRTMRGSRRLTRRKKHRLERVKEELEKINIIQPDYKKYCNTNPYAIRLKGLTQKLTKEELYIAIMHLTKRRGISYLEDFKLDDKNKDITNKIIKENLELSKNNYICEIQLDRLKKENRIRGHENVFETKEYLKELEKILKTQQEYYDEIDDELISKLKEIVKSKRDYSTGPGNEKSRTDYGIFRTNGETLDNLFEILIGKCSIFPDEMRCPKGSYDAQLFNFLNDLNNIKVNGNKLTKQKKEEIYHKVLNSKSVNMMKLISKVTNVSEDLIEGYRIDRKNNPEFHKFEIYKNFMSQLEKQGIDTSVIDINAYNEISYCLTLETEKSKKRERLNKSVGYLGSEIIEAICDIDDSKFNKWHSLSYKAINEILDDLWNTSKEQQTLFLEHNLLKPDYELYKGKKNIPTDFIDEEVTNPVARRSVRQTINILNAIRKKYGELDTIIIEMAREFTTDPKEIEREQKKNFEKRRKAALLAEPYGYTYESLPGDLLIALCLWQDQDGRCIYSNKPIPIDKLINNYELFQIDHIIPKAVSFDDGYNNKVLCYRNENQKKGKRTPSRYFASGEASITYEEYQENVLTLFKSNLISNKKKELLLFDKDITKYEVRQGFINRNLQDTRYSTKLVLNTLQNYMKANEIKTKIFTVKGAYTNAIRNKWHLNKDRQYYKHHVVDALIIAASNNNSIYKTNSFYENINSIMKFEEGRNNEVLSNNEYDSLVYKEPYPSFIRNLKELNPRISHKVDTKFNRAISDQTIKSSKIIDGEEYIVSKFSNIYDKSGEELKKKIEKNPEDILMYHQDKETFNTLKKVINDYPDAKNPFAEYLKEHNEKIKRYAKNGNGPDVISVRYIQSKLGNHLSISHKYNNPKNNVFLLSIKPYRMDVYKNNENTFKFISITNSMFKFKNKELVLDAALVNETKERKVIDNCYKFCFSLYKGDVFSITIDKNTKEYIFMGVNSDTNNKIECNYVEKQRDKSSGERIKLSIGKNVKEFRKIHTDILGYKYYCTEEDKKMLTVN